MRLHEAGTNSMECDSARLLVAAPGWRGSLKMRVGGVLKKPRRVDLVCIHRPAFLCVF